MRFMGLRFLGLQSVGGCDNEGGAVGGCVCRSWRFGQGQREEGIDASKDEDAHNDDAKHHALVEAGCFVLSHGVVKIICYFFVRICLWLAEVVRISTALLMSSSSLMDSSTQPDW